MQMRKELAHKWVTRKHKGESGSETGEKGIGAIASASTEKNLRKKLVQALAWLRLRVLEIRLSSDTGKGKV